MEPETEHDFQDHPGDAKWLALGCAAVAGIYFALWLLA